MHERICSIDDCDRPVLARGWCHLHYDRWRRHGDPAYVIDQVHRFWAKVDKDGPLGCWMWTGGINKWGYGETFPGSRRTPAHRYAYELLVGPIPDGLVIDHLCRVRRCVNPAHLEPVANGENVLRGVSLSAQNARKTHCNRGHEFTAENTIVNVRGERQCRICSNERARRAYARARARRAS